MAIPRTPSFIGQIAVFGPNDREEERSDFRDVPSSDRGNENYKDRGRLGTYAPTAEPYREPAEVKFDGGYGATDEDFRRGYSEVELHEVPAYEFSDYKERWTQPRETFNDKGNTDNLSDDWEFRSRNRRSRGFLTRPRIPTER